LVESGVDVQHVRVDPALKTGLGIALCKENDRAILTYPGSLNAIFPKRSAMNCCVQPSSAPWQFFLQTNLRPAMAASSPRAHFRPDLPGYQLGSGGNMGWRLRETLPQTDIFFPNEQEARFISRTSDLEEAIRVFKELGVAITAVKQGEKGALVLSRDERHSCVLPAATGGDSIGAGDSFDAGFLAGWLRGLPLEQCLRIASHCGRQVAANAGGIRSQPDWATVIQLAGIKSIS
jgi:sugar/nucleoside kinase (ribokinase family)